VGQAVNIRFQMTLCGIISIMFAVSPILVVAN